MSIAVSITQDGTVLKTAGKYVDQDIVVGISDGIKKTAATYTPSTSDQVIPAGKFLSGDQTVKGDANLVAGNIKQGVSIFGVNGTLTPGITPSGVTDITTNGAYDVTQFASANVNVPKVAKIARGSFSGNGSWALDITHNLGTRNVIVFVQAVDENGSPIIQDENGRYITLFLCAWTTNFLPSPNQIYKMSSTDTEQLIGQYGTSSNFGTTGKTETNGVYWSGQEGASATSENIVHVATENRFRSNLTYQWLVIGLLEGI